MANQKSKSERQKRHEKVAVGGSKFSVNLTINAMVGIMLAILGTFILFFGQSTELTSLLIRIIGVIAVCLGTVAAVNYFRHKNSGKSLAIGIVEIVVGIALIIAAAQISKWIFLALGILVAVYGIYLLFTSKGSKLAVVMGIVYILLGVLVILYTFGWQWVTDWGKYPIGIAAYIGAVFFLFF